MNMEQMAENLRLDVPHPLFGRLKFESRLVGVGDGSFLSEARILEYDEKGWLVAITDWTKIICIINAGNNSEAGLAESQVPAPSEPGDRGVAPTTSAPSPAPE